MQMYNACDYLLISYLDRQQEMESIWFANV